MPIIYHTKNIDQAKYTKLIRRMIFLNGYNGKEGSGFRAWENFVDNWTMHIIPVEEQEDYKRFYGHLNVETSDGIAWGVTGQKVIYMFINDMSNTFIIRQNMMPIGHEVLHAIYQDAVGTAHLERKYDAPEGSAGTRGAGATVIVHDNWYGSRDTLRIWIRWGIIWLPITIPYIPVVKAKEIYGLL